MAVEYSKDIDHPRMRVGLATSFAELVKAEYSMERTAVIFMRKKLSGDFNALARKLGTLRNVTFTLDYNELTEIRPQLMPNEDLAAQAILDDMIAIQLCDSRRMPELRIRTAQEEDQTDTKFHVDGGRTLLYADQFLCNYNNPRTEWVCSDDVVSPEEEDNRHLSKALFYEIKKNADIFTFPLHSVWRHACAHVRTEIPPFIHRGTKIKAGETPRLLLAAFLRYIPGFHKVKNIEEEAKKLGFNI